MVTASRNRCLMRTFLDLQRLRCMSNVVRQQSAVTTTSMRYFEIDGVFVDNDLRCW